MLACAVTVYTAGEAFSVFALIFAFGAEWLKQSYHHLFAINGFSLTGSFSRLGHGELTSPFLQQLTDLSRHTLRFPHHHHHPTTPHPTHPPRENHEGASFSAAACHCCHLGGSSAARRARSPCSSLLSLSRKSFLAAQCGRHHRRQKVKWVRRGESALSAAVAVETTFTQVPPCSLTFLDASGLLA